jgi:hypothetical protein
MAVRAEATRPLFPRVELRPQKKSILHLQTCRIMRPSLRWRAVGQCSTNATSDVIERGPPKRVSAVEEKPAGSRTAGRRQKARTGARCRTHRPARRRRFEPGSEKPPPPKPMEIDHGARWTRVFSRCASGACQAQSTASRPSTFSARKSHKDAARAQSAKEHPCPAEALAKTDGGAAVTSALSPNEPQKIRLPEP